MTTIARVLQILSGLLVFVKYFLAVDKKMNCVQPKILDVYGLTLKTFVYINK